MEKQVDARGDACPLPVVKAKRALNEIDEGTLDVLVDNETAVHNLEKLAEKLKCDVSHEQSAENEYAVHFTKIAAQADAVPVDDVCPAVNDGGGENAVVVISSATMGEGSDELGATLMKGFIFALTQQDVLPKTVLLYNGGVHLSCEGSPALDDLRALQSAGVSIMSCGTCLNFYGLTEKLAVGEVTNMYVIAEAQLQASVVVRP